MSENIAERRAVLDWFKNDFSHEAEKTTKTARMPDGTLAYNFSVTNTSGVDFEHFKFKVKVIDSVRGAELGTATINAGEWDCGARKNFKSRFSIPDNVTNISFVMFAETIDYEAKEDEDVKEILRDVRNASERVEQTMGNAGDIIDGMFGELFGTGGMPGADKTSAGRTSVNTNRSANAGRPAGAQNRNSGGSTVQSTGTRVGEAVGRAAGEAVGRATQSYSKKKTEKKLNKMRLGKSGWTVFTLVMGIIFAVAALGSISLGDTAGIIESGVIAAICFGISVYLKTSLGKRAKRIRTYETRFNKKGNTSIDDLAAAVGRPFEKVADELHQMIVDGFFPGAYVDIENRMLVMTENGQPIEDVARSVAQNRKAKRKAAREDGVVPESLDDLITMTDDSEIKAKLKSLRSVTKKIDARVEAVPELEKQVEDFREKFYPEVVRLTDEYNEKIVDMGKYGEENVKPEVTKSAEGAPVLNTNPNYLQEQAAEIKTQLISLIDSLTEASENLLEKLHEDDIMDITTDIKMLQTTLASKGLLDSDFDVK